MNKDDEIIVYWSPLLEGIKDSNRFLNFKTPEPVIKELKKLGERLEDDGNINTAFLMCPSVVYNVKNVFTCSSPLKLTLTLTKERLITPDHNQDFFDKNIFVRNAKHGFLSSPLFHAVFFTEEPSLVVIQKTAVYSDNEFTRKAGIIEGNMDIGQWLRPFDIAFYFKEEGTININYEDVLFYIEFLTDKKIIFKRFDATASLLKYSSYCTELKKTRSFSLKTYLQECYNFFNRSKLKKLILKEIKDNLMD
jgi:hypothetical protein